jgi:hypothetical protein
MALTYPRGVMILTNLILHNVRRLPCKFEMSGKFVLEKKILKNFSNINTYKKGFLYCDPGGLEFNKLDSALLLRASVQI